MVGIIKCPHCGTRVIPKSDGTCPNCRKLVTETDPVAASVPVTRPPQPQSAPATPASPRVKPPPAHRPFTTRAWDLTRQHRTLWIFGFFAGLSFGGISIGLGYFQGGAWFLQNVFILFNIQTQLSFVALLIAFIFWLAGNTARIALVRHIAMLESNTDAVNIPIIESFRTSTTFLPKIILMQAIVWLPYIAVQAISYYLPALQIGMVQSDVSETGTVLNPAVALGIFLVFIPMGVLLPLVDAFSCRGIVLDELGITEAIKKAIGLLRPNVRTIWSMISFLYSVGSLTALFVIFLVYPILFSLLQKVFVSTSNCLAGINDIFRFTECAGEIRNDPALLASFLIIGIVLAMLTSVPAVFQSTTMTLAYLKFSRHDAPVSD